MSQERLELDVFTPQIDRLPQSDKMTNFDQASPTSRSPHPRSLSTVLEQPTLWTRGWRVWHGNTHDRLIIAMGSNRNVLV